MNMTKRDVADIVLVFIAVSFIMSLITSIVTLGIYIGMTQEALQYMNKSTAIGFQVIQIVVLLLLNYVLLFKRSRLLIILFPDGKDKELSIPSGLESLTHYVFWIRIFGFFTFLSSGVHFFSRLASDVSSNPKFVTSFFWVHSSGAELISSVMGLFIIYKAEWIVQKIGKNK